MIIREGSANQFLVVVQCLRVIIDNPDLTTLHGLRQQVQNMLNHLLASRLEQNIGDLAPA